MASKIFIRVYRSTAIHIALYQEQSCPIPGTLNP
jgi:hypothetical protein